MNERHGESLRPGLEVVFNSSIHIPLTRAHSRRHCSQCWEMVFSCVPRERTNWIWWTHSILSVTERWVLLSLFYRLATMSHLLAKQGAFPWKEVVFCCSKVPWILNRFWYIGSTQCIFLVLDWIGEAKPFTAEWWMISKNSLTSLTRSGFPL